MKALAYLLITAGFLVGSYFSVIDTEQVDWSRAAPGLLVGLAGVALAQVLGRTRARAADTLRANLEKLERSLERIVASAEKLDADKDSLDPYAVHHRIDQEFMEDLDIFVDNRESIGHAFGLQSYADVMTHFATGERYLNRCWSASTDGYIDEVRDYLGRAREQFTLSLDLLRRHTRGG